MDFPRIEGYTATAEVGRGGMSVIYSAANDKLKSRHAIKLFDVQACRNRDALSKKFIAEARLLATLKHPNIVRVTDCGTLQDGRPWYAMDFIEGVSLAVRLAQPIPPDKSEIARWYREIRSALAYCHAHGVVHGDIKAENIMINTAGSAILADFGIARVLEENLRKQLDLTSSTLPSNFGTSYTLAPECRYGAPATFAADVYSFGVVLHKLVTGIWFEGSPRSLEQLPRYSPEWAPLLLRMLSLDPALRAQDATLLPEDAPQNSEPFPLNPECAGNHSPDNQTQWFRRKAFWFTIVFILLAFLGYLLERQERQDAIRDKILQSILEAE